MSTPKRVLVVSPHADDETLGVGGTIARHVAEGDHVSVAVLTGHGEDGPHPLWPQNSWTVVRAEARRAMTALGVEELIFERIPGARVAGVDSSPSMMEIARKRLAPWEGRFIPVAGAGATSDSGP